MLVLGVCHGLWWGGRAYQTVCRGLWWLRIKLPTTLCYIMVPSLSRSLMPTNVCHSLWWFVNRVCHACDGSLLRISVTSVGRVCKFLPLYTSTLLLDRVKQNLYIPPLLPPNLRTLAWSLLRTILAWISVTSVTSHW
jgi:hypothetical protein